MSNYPEFPDSSVLAHFATDVQVNTEDRTCNDSLQVGSMAVGMVVEGERGPSLVLSIDEAEWRFSRKPALRMKFSEIATGYEYRRMYHPSLPILGNLLGVVAE